MKKTIQLNGVDPMIFAGVNDQNIKIIDTNFDSNIVLRGNKLIIEIGYLIALKISFFIPLNKA